MLGSKLDIFNKDWTDVIFKGRNKEYGAYELRKQNSRSTNLALIIGSAVFIFIISINTIVNAIEGFIPKAPPVVKLTDVKLLPPPPVDQTKKPPPPPPEPPKPKVDQVKFPPPVVKPDNEVKTPPPTVTELAKADPGQNTQKGNPNADINIDQPVGNSDAKVTEADPNTVFAAVEQEPEFRNGGAAGFNAYLAKAVKFPAVDRENGTSGKVIITFVVEKDGSLTDIKVLRAPSPTMGDAAKTAVQSSPAWKPGKQNGQSVRVQFTISFAFSLADADQ
jgi:protein TonB